MNPHDVLGVRPNASREEIELAYRGRRAQYHPDKYAGSDSDTIQWATGKMQELNLAYAALSGSGGTKALPPGGNNAPRHTADQPTTVPSLADILGQLGPVRCGRTYFAPRIPHAKLHNAIGGYGQGLDAQDVVVLIDTTLMGGARDGVLLAKEGIWTKELMEQPIQWSWKEIRQIAIQGTALHINGRKVIDCGMAEAKELHSLFALVQQYAQMHNQAGQGYAASSTTPSERTQVFKTARARLLDLCEMISPLEQQIGQSLIDRKNAASHFALLEECLSGDARAMDIGLSELLDIEALCRHMITYSADESHDLPDDLLQAGEADSQLVRELRYLLVTMVRTRRERQGSQMEEFFRR